MANDSATGFRLERKKTKFPRRAYKHVNNFIRVQIHLRDGTEFPLTLDVNNSLDYVAKQIEAEATFRNIGRSESSANALDDLSKAIDVYQLYDAVEMAIPFSALVRDILKFDDDIYPVTSIEESAQSPKETGLPKFVISQGSVFNLLSESPDYQPGVSTPEMNSLDNVESPVVKNAYSVKLKDDTSVKRLHLTSHSSMNSASSKRTSASTIDDRLDSVLHNISALQFFNEFCLQAYSIENVLFWIEAEVLRSITDEKERDLFSKHIYNAYVTEEAPLALNLDSEIRQAVTSKFDQMDKNAFKDLQSFIFMLLKQSAYTRFEESDLFQKFLRFKTDDRYAYVQGKTMWDYEAIKKNLKEIQLQPMGKLDEESSPSLFREKVLLDVIQRYFPRSLSVPNKYFNGDDRRERIQKSRQVKKQKRLTKFFGFRPSEEQIRSQNDDDNDEMSITNSEMEPLLSRASSTKKVTASSPRLDQKRKKAEKLTGFFGDQLPSREMRRQSLMHGLPASSNPALDDQDSDIVGSLNKLTQEERIILQKRAKKLLAILGSDSEGKPISHNLVVHKNYNNAVPSHASSIMLEIDSDSNQCIPGEVQDGETEAIVSLEHSSSPKIGGNKRKKVEKVVDFFGNQKAREEIQKQSRATAEREEDNDIPPPSPTTEEAFDFLGGVNELTPEEKLILQRRAKKLLGILGNNVDGSPISPNQIVGDHQNRAVMKFQIHIDIEATESSTFPSMDEQVNTNSVTRSKLEKLSKTLGEKISEIQLKDYLNPEEQTFARPLSPLEKRAFKKKNDKLERVFGNVVPAEEVIYYGNTTGPVVGEKTENAVDGEDTSPFVSSFLVSDAHSDEGHDEDGRPDEDKQSQLIRLRKLKKMLGITEGVQISEDALKKIYDAVNRVVENEDDRKSILDELDRMALSPTEKKALQRKNQKMEQFFGKTVPVQEIVNSGGVRVDDDRYQSDYDFATESSTASDRRLTEEKVEHSGVRPMQTVSRLRKLTKMLGINDETGPMTEDAIRAVQEAIQATVEDEEDKRSLLEELSKKSRISVDLSLIQ